MSLLVDSLGYVAIGTPDLAASTSFFRDVCQLEVSEERDGVTFLRGDFAHHWLRLEQRAEADFLRVGYRATDAASLAEIIRRLDTHGVAWKEGGTMKEDRVVGGVRFEDPNGIEVEVYEEMIQMPVEARSNGIRLEMLLHAVFRVPDFEASRDFWRDVLDFRRSDQIEDFGVFMRCGNKYHHSVAFFRGARAKLDHFCMLTATIDDVMRMQGLARHLGVPLENELGRHAASGSIGCYLKDERLKIGVEYCIGHGQLEDDDPGRLLVASASTANVWKALPHVDDGSWASISTDLS